MKKITAALLLAGISLSVSAQQKIGYISGFIKDHEGNPLPGATVSLLRAKDSALSKTAIADREGRYEMEYVATGQYLLSAATSGFVKSFGRQPFQITESQPRILAADLQLQPSSTSLQEVTLVSRKPFIETKVDKTVVNVDASPTSAGASALELLEKSPGVIVNNDGLISLRGKPGVIVMVDGKQTFLSPADLANLLKNMPATSIEQFEIMTNPSAKFDAAGNSGIINIKTKKGKANGFNGSLTLGATTSFFNPNGSLYVMPKSQNSFNFNYRKNKFNFFGSYNPNFFRGRNFMNIDRKFISSNGALLGYNEVETRFNFRNTNHTLKLGFDFYADKRNTFSFTASGFSMHGFPTPVTVTNSLDASRQLQSAMVSTTENDNKFRNLSGSVNYRHVFDSTGRELTADADFITYRNTGDMLLTTDFYDAANNPTGDQMLLKGHLPAIINIFTVKTDYVHPFKSGLKLEAGLKSSFVSNDNEVDYRRFNGGKWDIDNRSNHFIYEENIHAAYLNISKQVKKWSLQGGLRLENTVAKGHQLTNDSTFRRNFTNLFPSVFVNYAVSKKHALTLSYSRRITRPNYQDLNPFTFFLDSLSYRQGNPFLTPQFTHNIELSHAFKGKIITTLNYNTTQDVISQLLKQNDNDRIVFLTVDNVAKFRNIGLSVTVPVSVTRWWNLNFFTNIFNNHYQGIYNADPIDISYTSFMANTTSTFTVKKGFTLELSGFYRAKGLDNLSIAQPVYQMSIGAQKQVLNGKGSVRLNIRDPFAWQRFQHLTQYSNIDVKVSGINDARQVTATFTLRFGKSQQQPQRRRANASQEEQNRVGSGG